MLGAVWRYRQFILTSIWTEFVGRFIRSQLGGVWAIIHPLALVLIYSLILSGVLQAKLPGIEHGRFAFAVYLMGGILGYSLFAELINRCLDIFIANGNLLKKMAFPKLVLPIIAAGGCLLNNVLLLFTMLAVFVFLGQPIGALVLWYPVIALVATALGLGIGLVLGTLNVFIRDVGQATTVALQFAFWFTPIVYPATIIPEQYQHLLDYNPLYPIVQSYQNIFLFEEQPEFGGLTVVLAIAAALLMLALFMVRRSNAEMVDMV